MRRRVFVILQAVTLSVTAAGVARAQTLEERRERVLARDAELTNVAAMLARKVSPSNGDQPHFDST